MQKITKNTGTIRIISTLLDTIVLLYFASYMYWIFAVLNMDNHPLSVLFVKVNPMTIGAYCMGVAMIVHLIAFRNPIGVYRINVPVYISTINCKGSLYISLGL